jgi:hypothetical protein
MLGHLGKTNDQCYNSRGGRAFSRYLLLVKHCAASRIQPYGEKCCHCISAFIPEQLRIPRDGYGVQADNGEEETVIRSSGVLELHPVGECAKVVP